MTFTRLIFRRTIQAIPLFFGILLTNFLIIHLAPGDPASFLAGAEASPGYIEALRAQWGLDKPVLEQFVLYIAKVLHGDLGYSFAQSRPVIEVVLERVPNTLLLMSVSFTIAVLLGITFGVISSRRPYGVVDSIVSIGSLVVYSLPEFWIGIVLVLTLGLYLNLFPVQGMITPGLISPISRTVDLLWHLVLPATVLGLAQLAMFSRQTRANMLEVIGEDYIVTARCKGCDERTVLYKHALRNAMLPVVTTIGLRVQTLFTGAVVVEEVFAWPGTGRLLFAAIHSRDYTLLMGIFIIVSVLVIVGNILADIAYALVDPRVRYTKES